MTQAQPPHRPRPQAAPGLDVLNLAPLPQLMQRMKELAGAIDLSRPLRLSRAPGRLDVMGGIADYTGSMVCEATLQRAAAAALQERDDRELQVFSFNLLDEHSPFTFRIPLQALAEHHAEALRREFAEAGRKWAGYIAGCLFILHEQKLIDLSDSAMRGLNLAVLSTVPIGAGVGSSAALEVATMMALVDHFGLRESGRISPPLDALRLARLCQQVENRIVGAPSGIMDQVTSCAGETESLLRMICQPHDLLPPLRPPDGIRLVGLNSGVRHSVGGLAYTRTRCAAFMGHAMILAKMREMGEAAGKRLEKDPMNGYLANLDPDDYKKYFRPFLPERIKGLEFLEEYGPTQDEATTVHPDHEYAVRQAADHHVLEAQRVRSFAHFLEEAHGFHRDSRERGSRLDKAGHLMYASHLSYTNDALLGADECDLLVDLARAQEPSGLYGARITGGGGGGTVAIMADISARADAAIARIMAEYQQRTGRKAELLTGSSPGAWQVGTAMFA